jgi:hypothetical protein
LSDLLAGVAGRERDAAEAARAEQRARADHFERRIAPPTGRNDPCLCGRGSRHCSQPGQPLTTAVTNHA